MSKRPSPSGSSPTATASPATTNDPDPGNRRPEGSASARATIHDVAREAGVSITTVSRALNNKGELRAETRSRILATAARMQFVPSSVAQALVSGRTKTLGVLITDNTSPVFADLLGGIQEVANASQFGLLYGNSADSQELALSWLSLVHAKQIDGLLLTPVQTDRRDVEQLGQWSLSFVLLLRYFADLATDAIFVDNVQAGYLVTQHLLDLGHRRIGHVAGPPYISSAVDRLAGYRRAHAEYGLAVDDDLVTHGPFTVAGGLAGFRYLLDRPNRPTAIFAATDLQAVGVMKGARAAGLRIPDDLALAGGDDIELAEFLAVPLTTFRSPNHEIGCRAAQLLLDRLDGDDQPPQQIVAAPELIVRQSSGGSASTQVDHLSD